MRVNFDWTRDPPPEQLTPFQVFTRNVDWEKSPLGLMSSWPNQLRQTVLLLMADPSPSVVYWGPEQAIVYNEAYVPLIGQKHPNLQGQNPRTGGFAEIWDHFDNVLKTGERTGETHMAARSMLLLNRYGFLEETYFSWKFIPMICEEGYVVASYATVIENTREFISDRRMLCVQELSSQIANVTELEQFWPAVLSSLSSNDKDIPFALLYSVDEDEHCKLTGTLGVESGHPCAPLELYLSDESTSWTGLMQKALRASSPLLARVEDHAIPEALFEGIEWRGFGVPCGEFVLCPIRAGDLSAVLILGLNQRKPFDSDYQQFINLITSQLITPHVLNIALAAEVAARKERAEQIASDQALLSKQLSARTREFQESMKFTRFADRAPIGLCVKDSAGSTIYENHAWTEFAGTEEEDVAHSKPPDASYNQIPLVHDWWKSLPQQEQNGTFQVRSREPFVSYSKTAGPMKADNKTGICATYADYDEERNVSTTMGLVVDVSELVWIQDQVRRRTEELERSELNYRRFADNAPVGVCRFNRSGMIDFANDAWTVILKQSGKSVTGATWMDSLHADDLGRFKGYLYDLKNFKVAPPIECRLRRSYVAFDQPGIDQHPAWILVSGHAEVGPDGILESTVCWITDISAQKAAVKVMTIKVEEALGLKRQQENFIDMISHEIRNPLSAVLHCAEEISQSLGIVSSRSDKSCPEQRPYLDSAVEAAQTIIFCVQHQRRLVDDILTLSKLDSDLIRLDPIPVQPVQLVRRATGIFEKELKAASITLTIEESKSLSDLKLGWTFLDPNRYLQVLINLITNAIKFTRSCELRSIHIKIDATSTKPSCNPGEIEYFPRRVENTAADEQEEHVYMVLSVSDTGIGIKQAEKGALFKQFSQVSPKTSVKYGGTGLGLFISRQITEMMGGEIGMTSVFGQGSTFAFFVRAPPIQSPSAAEEVKARSDQDITLTQLVRNSSTVTDVRQDYLPKTNGERPTTQNRAAQKSALRILVVEDNLINQRVLCKQLRNRGYLVEAANHGGEGITALREGHDSSQLSNIGKEEQPFHMILCDIEMPVMNGIEFVKEVRKLEAEGTLKGHSSIIAVTANARSGQVEKALEAGMDGFTTKPYQMNELIAEISRVYLSNNKTSLAHR